MKDQKVSTILGTTILIIIAATAAGFVLLCFKNYSTTFDVKLAVIQPRERINKNKKEDQNSADIIVQKNAISTIGNWVECYNERSGYIIKYPEDWIIGLRGPFGFEKLDECTSSNLLISNSINVPVSIGSVSIHIDVADMTGRGMKYEGSKSLDDYFDKMPDVLTAQPIIREFLLNNEKAVYLADYPNPVVFIYHNNKVYEIDGKNITEQLFSDFLSTFVFLD
jgi:hypothetical protein